MADPSLYPRQREIPEGLKAEKGWDRVCFPEDSHLCMKYTLEDKTERDYVSVWGSALWQVGEV